MNNSCNGLYKPAYLCNKPLHHHGPATLPDWRGQRPSHCLAPAENYCPWGCQATRRGPFSHLQTATALAGDRKSARQAPVRSTPKDHQTGGSLHHKTGDNGTNQHRQAHQRAAEGSDTNQRVRVQHKKSPPRSPPPCPSPSKAAKADPCPQKGTPGLVQAPCAVDMCPLVQGDVYRWVKVRSGAPRRPHLSLEEGGRAVPWRMRAASNSLWWRLQNGLGWILCPSQNSPAPCARQFKWSTVPRRNSAPPRRAHATPDWPGSRLPGWQRPTSSCRPCGRLPGAVRGGQDGLASLQPGSQPNRKFLGPPGETSPGEPYTTCYTASSSGSAPATVAGHPPRHSSDDTPCQWDVGVSIAWGQEADTPTIDCFHELKWTRATFANFENEPIVTKLLINLEPKIKMSWNFVCLELNGKPNFG